MHGVVFLEIGYLKADISRMTALSMRSTIPFRMNTMKTKWFSTFVFPLNHYKFIPLRYSKINTPKKPSIGFPETVSWYLGQLQRKAVVNCSIWLSRNQVRNPLIFLPGLLLSNSPLTINRRHRRITHLPVPLPSPISMTLSSILKTVSTDTGIRPIFLKNLAVISIF